MRIRVSGAWSLAVALAAGLAACAPSDTEEDMAADSLALDTAAAPAGQAAQTLTDNQIARIVMAANTADSAAGELAQSKGSSEDVKAFARRMIQDHGASNQQSTQLAQRLGVTPEESQLSSQLQGDAQNHMQTLQGLSGVEFDRAYVDHEVMMHQQVLDAIDQQLIPNAQNAELRQLLQNTRPTIESHLQQAKQIQSKTGQPGGTPPAGGTGEGG